MPERKQFKQSIFSRTRATLAQVKEKKQALLGYSLASIDRTEIAFPDRFHFQKPQGKKALEIMYRNSWAINKAVNVRANLLSFRGLKIVVKDDKAKKVTNTFLKKMHPTRPMLALANTFNQRSKDVDVFGMGIDELLFDSAKVANAKDLLGFTAVHPINIDFQRAQNSDIIAFEKGPNGKPTNVPKGWVWHQDPDQDYQGGTKLELDRIASLKYNWLGDELWGMSKIEPVYKTAEDLRMIEEGMAQGVITYGNPTRDIIVGDETHPASKPMIDQVAAAVKNFNSLSEYVHPAHIRIGQIESFSLSKIPNYVAPYITAVGAAFEIPEFILTGSGEGTNKATAQAMINFVHQTIDPLQQKQAMYFEERILAPLMKLNKIDEVPTIEWNEILPRDPNDYANIIKVVSEALVGGKQIVTKEELREWAGLDSGASFKKPSGSELATLKKDVK